MAYQIEATANILDVRDIIERVEELETAKEAGTLADEEYEEGELDALAKLLAELAGNGGDEQWRGAWYPITLIHEDYFVEAMEELVKDIGDMPQEIPNYIEIDWDKTAENLRVDYATVEFDGNTFWYR